MKKYISIIAILLCALTSVNATVSTPHTHDLCDCCKNCKDDQCQDLCKKWSAMSTEERRSAEGQKVKDACMKICKEKKCCSADGTSATCEGMNDKGCCKKK
jgi:hypothetical protein